ncbi:CPBP family intramembrane glutamic endopeptidase [Kocuria sp.]|uniref:CPBP family intramembrane glutamic endopeptidase n=1 Tax=Kocuria sp. TaxID=1871328 RepID=UPI0026E10AB0|nr:CPBP family intramembrane glutamic endopeptidase [Kocuria sp.]MDO5618908.1 CPBP family intramembrane metalloprotease [Kocuria sp.]
MASETEPRSWMDGQRKKAQAAGLAPKPTLWDGLYAALLIVLTDLGTSVGVVLGGLAFGTTGALATSLVTSIAVATTAFWFLFLRRWTWHDLGFRPGRHSLWHLTWQIPVVVALTTLLFTTIGLALNVMSLRPGTGPQAQISPETPYGLILVLVPSLVLAPIQEILFRRILLDWLLQYMPILAAAGITVVIFAAVHLDATAILYSLLLGVALTAARLWYGNLWAPVIMACVVDATVLGIVLPYFS